MSLRWGTPKNRWGWGGPYPPARSACDRAVYAANEMRGIESLFHSRIRGNGRGGRGTIGDARGSAGSLRRSLRPTRRGSGRVVSGIARGRFVGAVSGFVVRPSPALGGSCSADRFGGSECHGSAIGRFCQILRVVSGNFFPLFRKGFSGSSEISFGNARGDVKRALGFWT